MFKTRAQKSEIYNVVDDAILHSIQWNSSNVETIRPILVDTYSSSNLYLSTPFEITNYK